ncbi:anthranilate phosphoribosyltransferase [Pseudoalteromonas denitrificans]|uniref:Anthranilate phosphoribosyltransferase n=1 Tax=Pseudoalteromonas denitrificans DSM 6059 TaxID=1123010 RepID=A0A1I1QUF0_9GAMM|nr:anthranilate phosphoribosyltransferase [Pseudoalteromonas denitrificans]SFD25726.1 anthranilate phosphoribosyltransferase [Pseudoalteromonas denitrificans DSM 6059]
MKEILDILIAQNDLDLSQSKQLFSNVMQGKLSEIELTAALIALKIKGETASEIAGAAAAMRNHATPFNTSLEITADSCGTGGDGSNTINVSTTAAIVAAACGISMVKHGNKSVSSNSGSADLLIALGINVNMPVALAQECLIQTGFTFLFAPNYHTGVKHAMPVRTQLKTRTLFNILGPLANPAAPKVQLLGVYDPELCLPMAQTLKMLGTQRALVVHGSGTDEIALHGTTKVIELNNGEISDYTLAPCDFGLAEYPLEAIEGKGPEYNAKATLAILKGEGKPAHNAAIIANVAALLYLTNKADSFEQGAKIVADILASGQTINTLNNIIKVSNKNVAEV